MTANSHCGIQKSWSRHNIVQAGTYCLCSAAPNFNIEEHRKHIEPWLSSLFQAEHLNVLVGNGLTTAIACAAQVSPVSMQTKIGYGTKCDTLVQKAAKIGADRLGRKKPNIEDQIRVVLKLIDGLCILDDCQISAKGNNHGTPEAASQLLAQWKTALNKSLHSFMKNIIGTERKIKSALSNQETSKSQLIGRLLGDFFLPFASRTASRERSHIFTTNYDRMIEYGCDRLGVRVLDRFVGNLEPIFRSTRLGLDLHYNPPGIRGEPRYLDGVVHLTKLHGSLDWRWRYASGSFDSSEVYRCSLPFGAPDDHSELSCHPGNHLLIYPNPAKDVETLEYPYAELFRDFAAAVCRPNTVVVTYGYGFGDDHINRGG